ncbi:MAG: PLDc N-terminal domain-containing protein [Saprospiraceae bacterium]
MFSYSVIPNIFENWSSISVCTIVGIIAIIDIFQSTFKDKNQKWIWFFVVLVFPFVGSIIYYFTGHKSKEGQEKKTSVQEEYV